MDQGKIYEAISNVMADIGAVGKNDVNKSQGFRYRGIDAVMNALNPAMVKHRVFCVPEILEQQREERTSRQGAVLIYSVCKIKYRFFTTDGSFVEAVTIGEGMDSGDKATNKAMAIAFKYACFQVFCIPTEEMTDPDGESHELDGEKTSGNKEVADKATEAQIKAIKTICEKNNQSVEKLFAHYNITEESLTKEQASALLKGLNAKYGGK